MQEVLQAIERHLGRTLPISKLDYYQVIGLELYCNDGQQIRKALQDATNRWMQSETGRYPESAQIIAKLLKQAQIILLDPEKRERYNLQLEKLRNSQPDPSPSHKDQASSKPDSSEHVEENPDVFPNADPMVPFSFEVASANSASRGNSCALLERIRDPHARLIELEQLFPSLAEYENESETEDHQVASYSISSPSSRDATSGGGLSLAQQIARRRKRRRVLVSLMFFFGSQLILGVSIWAYLQSQRASNTKGLAKGQWDATNPNAPKLPGIPNKAKSEEGVFQRKPSSQPEAMSKPEAQTKPNEMQTPVTVSPTQPVSPSQPESTAQPEPQPASAASPDDPKPMSNATVPPEKSAPNMESDTPIAESMEWKKLMANARKALDRADFETFEKEIATGVETAKTSSGREQAARLDQLGQLYKIGSDSFQEAKKKLKGTSSIRMGTTEVSIVDNTAEKLVVRVSGKNQAHTWEKLPFGLAIGMLDLTLDPEAPTDVATRAVYFSMAPQFRDVAAKNELLKKRIAAWFDKSAGKAPIRADLPQALTDSFE
jgi:hypothetical protein